MSYLSHVCGSLDLLRFPLTLFIQLQMDSFWGVSSWWWPSSSQLIRGRRISQLWSLPETPRLWWKHQGGAHHRYFKYSPYLHHTFAIPVLPLIFVCFSEFGEIFTVACTGVLSSVQTPWHLPNDRVRLLFQTVCKWKTFLVSCFPPQKWLANKDHTRRKVWS